MLPWSRTYLNGIANLVAADKKCNGDKSDTLPTIEYFKAAVGREASLLSQIADNFNFPIQLSETLAVGKGLYLSTPSGSNLWAGPNSYESWHGVFSALKAD
ncbi:MAG: hypothetical protein EBR84_01305 [Actinobacteria bacterium]|nr:hypothetical protein [Actinomycetota bacterium]